MKFDASYPKIALQTAEAAGAGGSVSPSQAANAAGASLGELASQASEAAQESKARREGKLPVKVAPTTPEPAKQTPAVEPAGTAGASEGQTDGWVNPIAELLQSEFGPKEPPKDELDLGADVKPETATKFQTLRGRAQEAERARDAYAQQFNQLRGEANQVLSNYQRQLQETQNAMQAMREQNAALAARVEMFSKYGPNAESREPDAGQQLIDRIRNEIRQSEIEPLRKQLSERDQRDESFQREQQVLQNAGTIREEAISAWNKIVLNGVADNAKSRDLMLGGPAALIALRGARQVPLSQIGPEFRRLVLQTAQDILDSTRASAAKARTNADAGAAKMPPAGAPSVLEGAALSEVPSLKHVMQNGFTDALQWVRAGRPKLKPLRE